jgi:hypothetical protein
LGKTKVFVALGLLLGQAATGSAQSSAAGMSRDVVERLVTAAQEASVQSADVWEFPEDP